MFLVLSCNTLYCYDYALLERYLFIIGLEKGLALDWGEKGLLLKLLLLLSLHSLNLVCNTADFLYSQVYVPSAYMQAPINISCRD